MNNLLKNAKNILRKKIYLVLFLILSILFFIGSYYLTIYKIAGLNNFIYVNGINFTIFYFILSFLISLLLGFYLTLSLYRFNLNKKINYKYTSGSLFGALLGALGSGCPGCSFTLFSSMFSLFGLSLGLASLPLKGLELKIFGVIFLFGSNYFSLKNLDKRICK